MIRKLCFLVPALVLAPVTAFAQTAVQELRADFLSGASSSAGRIIVAGEQLVFISDTNPADSFFVPRTQVQSLMPDRDMLVVQLREPVRDRTGERLRLTFRMLDEKSAASAANWLALRSGALSATAPGAGSSSEPAPAKTYQVRHKKRFGGSTGRLIISHSGIAYESIDNASASRRWEISDIRELKLKNPYEIEIVPAGGDKYTLEIQGQGMDAADYNALVDRITKARALR